MNGYIKLLTQIEDFKRTMRISYKSEDLIAEVNKELEIYDRNTKVLVWADPEDCFIKDYEIDDLDEAEEADEFETSHKALKSFYKNKNQDDIYLISLEQLKYLLEKQNEV